MTDYNRSVLFIILGGVFLSTLGIGTRWMESASGLQIVFYRSVGLAIFSTALVLIRYKAGFFSAYRSAGKIGLVTCLFLSGASIFIVLAVVNTTVANAMFIISLAPMIAGVFAWLLLGERVDRKTWMAMALALVGVLVIVNGALSAQGMLGIMYAFMMLICYGMFVVCLRLGKDLDMIPAISLSAWLLILIIGVSIDELSIPINDFLICLALGVFQVGLGMFLLVAGSIHVPAAQMALLAMVEVVLSPVWVWLGAGEQPATATLVGGGVILMAICYQALANRRPQS